MSKTQAWDATDMLPLALQTQVNVGLLDFSLGEANENEILCTQGHRGGDEIVMKSKGLSDFYYNNNKKLK